MNKELFRRLFVFVTLFALVYSQCSNDCLDCRTTSVSTICAVCQGNSQTDYQGNCHDNTISKCMSYGPSDQCLHCQTTYTLINNTCQKSYSGCTFQGVNGQCFSCNFGMTLQNSICTGILNCASYQSPTTCITCADGYTLTNNICVDTSIGCNLKQSSNGACIQCKDGYFLSGFKCFANRYLDLRCYVLQGPLNCLFCKSGYSNVNGKCLLTNQISNIGLPQTSGTSSTIPQTNSVVENFNSVPTTNEPPQYDSHQPTFTGPGPTNITPTLFQNINTTLSTLQSPISTLQSPVSALPLVDPTIAAIQPIQSTISSVLPIQYTTSSTGSLKNVASSSISTATSISSASSTSSGSTASAISSATSTSSGSSGSSASATSNYIPINPSNNQFSSSSNPDPNCFSFNGSQCVQCSNRYYFGPSGRCTLVNPLCDQYDNRIGNCISCYAGYIVSNGGCVINQLSDPNCQSYSSLQQCLQCYQGYFLNTTTGICQKLSPLCNQSNPVTGACLSCFPGYVLNSYSGICQISLNDPNCLQFDSIGNCLKCASRYYISTQGKCLTVNPQCNDYNPANGACLSCYQGYTLNVTVCIVGTPTDINCQTFNGTQCVKCYVGYFLGQTGLCLQINPLCKTINPIVGTCTSCYQGYEVSGATCVISQSGDLNCKRFDLVNPNICLQCYAGFLIQNGKCNQQNPQCNTIDPRTGACLTCWAGYYLFNGACVIINNVQQSAIQITDPYCINWNDKICRQCVSGFYFSTTDNKCKQSDPLCKTSDPVTGNCLTCFSGYQLTINSKCQAAQKVQLANCNTVSNGICLQCSPYFYLSNGKCVAVSILCSTYDQITGQCTSCPYQFYLHNGTCQQVSIWDENCITYQNSFCKQCKQGFYLLIPNYTCNSIDPNCLSFNYQNSICNSCAGNKKPQGPNCL